MWLGKKRYMIPEFAYQGTELTTFAKARYWKRYLAAQLSPFIRGRVLEVGAGLGSMTRVLRPLANRSWTCVEPDAELCGWLRQAVQRGSCGDPSGLSIVTGSIGDIAPKTRFDTILYIDVLEHIEDDHRELARAARLLAPQGHLVVISPAHNALYSPFDRAIGHYRRYSRQSLRRVGPPELSLVRLRYLDCVGLLASLANRFLLRSATPSEAMIRVWDTLLVPSSRVVDPIFLYQLGKSVLAIWTNSTILKDVENLAANPCDCTTVASTQDGPERLQ